MDEQAWALIARIGDGLDCDCECDGHEENEPCTEACMVCISCEAANLLVLRNQSKDNVDTGKGRA